MERDRDIELQVHNLITIRDAGINSATIPLLLPHFTQPTSSPLSGVLYHRRKFFKLRQWTVFALNHTANRRRSFQLPRAREAVSFRNDSVQGASYAL